MIDQKICSRCEDLKPTSMFWKDSSKKSGFGSNCKTCRKDYTDLNKDKTNRRAKAYRDKHPERRKATKRSYYERNPDKFKGLGPIPLDVRRRSNYAYRARRLGFEPYVEKFSNEDVVSTYGDRCFFCRDGEFEVLDHFLPIFLGGTHVLKNVRPSCSRCNWSKGSLPPDLFLLLLQLPEIHAQDYPEESALSWRTFRGEHFFKRCIKWNIPPAMEYFTQQEVIDSYGDYCYYCLVGLFEHLDHYIPASAGGTHTLRNVRPSCQTCNTTKGNRIPEDVDLAELKTRITVSV